MKIKYDTNKLERIINDISVLTGVSIAFLDAEFKHICGRKSENDFCVAIQSVSGNIAKCSRSDDIILARCQKSRSFEGHICHAGLYDAVTPVIKNGVISGFVLMGRVRSPQSPECVVGENAERLNALYQNMPFFTNEKISSLRTLLQDIVFENAIIFDFDETIDKIALFIADHLNEDLKIGTICAKFGVSKNYLYEKFKNYYGQTVNDYITKLRIDKAKLLLTETKEPVYAICETVGINNYTYFCRLFKKEVGTSPTRYRKTGQ